MRGTYWYQESRVTHIVPEPLVQQVVTAIENYQRADRHPPKHIFVYRGGVSEGEYAAVLNIEKEAFVKAFGELQKKHKNFKIPLLTIVVVQNQSNYRIVPTNPPSNGKPHEQNVRAGTCVDKGIMHPELTEFLLVGHKTIQVGLGFYSTYSQLSQLLHSGHCTSRSLHSGVGQ